MNMWQYRNFLTWTIFKSAQIKLCGQTITARYLKINNETNKS